MIICDTNIIIEFYRNNQTIISELRQIGQANIAVSAVTAAELIYGAFDKKELHQIQKDLRNLNVLPIDNLISQSFLTLMGQFSLSHKLAIPDALIAATALEYSAPLFTLNLKDFRFVPNLSLHPIP